MDSVIVEDLPSDGQPIKPMSDPVVGSPVGHLRLVEYFGIAHPSSEQKLKLSEIWTFTEGSDEDRVLQVLKIKSKLGEPALGQNYLDRVYRYVKLRKQQRLIDEELRHVTNRGSFRRR